MTLFSLETNGEEDNEFKTHCTHPSVPVGPDFHPWCYQVMDQPLFFIAPKQIKEYPELKASDGNCWRYITCGSATFVQGHLLFKHPWSPRGRCIVSMGRIRARLLPISVLAFPSISWAKGTQPRMARDQRGGFCNALARRLCRK